MVERDSILPRAEIAAVLRRWQAGELTAAQVHTWAEDRYLVVDYDDREGEDEDSVANEVMGRLDMLNMNLMLPEDIPIYLEMLDTPPGQFAAGLRKFDAALDAIDYPSRQQRLKNDPFYAPFCR